MLIMSGLENLSYGELLELLECVLQRLPGIECDDGHIMWTRHQTRGFDVAACQNGSTLLETGDWMEYGCTAGWKSEFAGGESDIDEELDRLLGGGAL